jgi:hypothetical protein
MVLDESKCLIWTGLIAPSAKCRLILFLARQLQTGRSKPRGMATPCPGPYQRLQIFRPGQPASQEPATRRTLTNPTIFST